VTRVGPASALPAWAVLAARPYPLRPALIGLATLSTIVAAFAFVRAIPEVWGVDAMRNMAAATAALHGSFGQVPDYLYSPLAAVLTVPASLLPPAIAIALWLAARLGILLVGAAIATRGLARLDRVLIAICLVTFLPLLYDLEVGNVTVLVLAAIAIVAWNPDRLMTGIPMGLLLATAPKPQMIPVLVWMLVANRKALAGAITTAGAATLAGIAVTGIAAYTTWIATLRAPAYLNTGGEIINLAIWPQPPIVVWVGTALAVIGWAMAMRRGYWAGLLGAMCLGLLLAPYTLIYGAGVLPAAVPAAARAAPRATLLFAFTAPVALLLVFPLWVAAILGLAALLPAVLWQAAPDHPGGRRTPRRGPEPVS